MEFDLRTQAIVVFCALILLYNFIDPPGKKGYRVYDDD